MQGSPRYRLVGALRGLEPKHDDVDRALRHFTAWAEEHAGDHRAVLAEREALLALVDRAADEERWGDVIRLGRAIEGALAWGRCWAAWERVLLRVHAGASATGDAATEAWALHQLGTRAYGVGDVEHAQKLLEDAAAIRERLHDEPGLAATRQNLRVVTGRAPWPQRLSHASAVLITSLIVLLVGIGAFGGAALGDGRVPVVDADVPFIDAAETTRDRRGGQRGVRGRPGHDHHRRDHADRARPPRRRPPSPPVRSPSRSRSSAAAGRRRRSPATPRASPAAARARPSSTTARRSRSSSTEPPRHVVDRLVGGVVRQRAPSARS